MNSTGIEHLIDLAVKVNGTLWQHNSSIKNNLKDFMMTLKHVSVSYFSIMCSNLYRAINSL